MADNFYSKYSANEPPTVVTSLNGLNGAVTLVAGSNISLTPSGNAITIAGTGGSVTSVAATVPSFLSVSGSPITSSGTLAISYSGTALPILNGGTGQTTANDALNALLPTQTAQNNKFLQTDGTNTSWAVASSGTVTSVAMTVPAFLSVSGSPVTSSGTLALSLSGTALPVANGGTSLTTLTANNVILGNGASAPTFVAPSTSGNVLTSNGSTWVSSAPSNGTLAVSRVAVSSWSPTDGTTPLPVTLANTVANFGTTLIGGAGVNGFVAVKTGPHMIGMTVVSSNFSGTTAGFIGYGVNNSGFAVESQSGEAPNGTRLCLSFTDVIWVVAGQPVAFYAGVTPGTEINCLAFMAEMSGVT